jgi:hypothetical protein
MGASLYPAINPKTRFVLTLTSGTSWTVPTGVTYVNVTLQGGGAGGFGGSTNSYAGRPGQMISSTLTTTPGASISYSIGAGGTAGNGTSTPSGSGGTTTFTGATSAVGGLGTVTTVTGTPQGGYENGAAGSATAGGAGRIDVEYWA